MEPRQSSFFFEALPRGLELLRHCVIAVLTMVLLGAFCLPGMCAGPALTADSVFETPLDLRSLDAGAFAEWIDGHERRLSPAERPEQVLATSTTSPGLGIKYGDVPEIGRRHLRIAWQRAAAVGAVLVRGGGRLSVLRPDAPYPGNLDDESQWIAAVRLKGASATREEVGDDEYGVWVLPPQMMTRALRFTHVPDVADRSYAGWLGGAVVLGQRFANVAPFATIETISNASHASLINNGRNDRMWDAWSNGKEGATDIVSPDHPESILIQWPAPVTLSGLSALWAGFGAASVEIYTGDPQRSPGDAPATDWRRIGTYTGIANQYPAALGPNWLDFGQRITTRGVRLVITKPTDETHEHLRGKTKGGKRVWLGELMALAPLGAADPSMIAAMETVDRRHPPIAIPFDLPAPGYVTLVIDDSQGRRVRNLVAEQYFAAGHQIAWWDGTDDLGRDTDAAKHGYYHIPARFVAPGRYRMHGLVHGPIDLHYEFSVDSGTPPWPTEDGTGGWLADHSAPMSVAFVPGSSKPGSKSRVFIGSETAEQGQALVWVDLDGKKLGGRRTIADVWVGAALLARDDGPGRLADNEAFAVGYYRQEMQIAGLTGGDARLIISPALKFAASPLDEKSHDAPQVRGLAAHDAILALSLSRRNEILFVDARAKVVLGHAMVSDPRGVAYDSNGRLLVLSGHSLLRCDPPSLGHETNQPTMSAADLALQCGPLVADGLDDPQGITLDRGGAIYVSDWGNSHQVKVFRADGVMTRTIGEPGPPRAGPYNELHMNYPLGLTIDDRQHLWVAEADYQPKRISIWTLDGALWKAFYGPPQYGGGGTIDPIDKSRFYYGGMEYRLDWQAGTYRIVSVLCRTGNPDRGHPFADKVPETPLDLDGRRYMTNAYTDKPVTGADTATIWAIRGGRAVPVAALGKLSDWPELPLEDIEARLPAGVDAVTKDWRRQVIFLWSDRNGNGVAEPDELQLLKASAGGITVMPDLSFIASRVDDRTVRYRPTGFAQGDVPLYDLGGGETLIGGAQPPMSSGGNQALLSPEGWTIVNPGPKPFGADSLGGALAGANLWSYPNLWPGLHASHESPVPDRPGELIGPTRLLGGFVTPRDSDAGSLWAVDGNMGPIYLFTYDGLFVAQLLRDERTGKSWRMPTAPRDMLLNDVSPGSEDFWPSLTQTADGNIYVQVGSQSNLVRIDGLTSIRRLPPSDVVVTHDDLIAAGDYVVRQEQHRQDATGRHALTVVLRATAPRLDATLDDWTKANWVSLDANGTAAFYDSVTKPYDVAASIEIASDRLYAAFRTGDPDLLRNSGTMPTAPFATGGALDLLLGTAPLADDQRTQPVAGDVRLLVTKIHGKPTALLYRAVVPGTTRPVSFSSPWRTVALDSVEDVSAALQFAEGSGNYSFSIPLHVLGLEPSPGLTLRGDIGVRRGNGIETVQGSYWNNKATAVVADIPSEAELEPQLWGRWTFVRE